MATTVITTYPEKGLALATWTGLSTETGAAASVGRWADKTVHIISGTGTGTVEGSNDGTNWGQLHDPQGNALTAMAVGSLELIAENPLYIRVAAAAGTLVVAILGRDI